MNQYVGIPYKEKACWELCRTVYSEQFGIELPAMGEPTHLSALTLDGPVEGCLVYVRREPPMSEHWGVYCAGYVLHAQQPSSVMVPLRRFMQDHARAEFVKVIE